MWYVYVFNIFFFYLNEQMIFFLLIFMHFLVSELIAKHLEYMYDNNLIFY